MPSHPHREYMNDPVAVLFDWDNTLMDTTHASFEAFCKVMSSFGKNEPTYAQFLSIPPYSEKVLFQKILPGQYNKAMVVYDQCLPRQRVVPMPGSIELLNVLHQHAIPMAVVSNKKGSVLRQEVDALQWSHYFFAVVGAGDAARDKPFADPLVYAVGQSPDLVCSPDLWFVGDSFIDKECAHNAGCTSVLIHKNAHNAFPLFQSCQDLLLYIRRILEKKNM